MLVEKKGRLAVWVGSIPKKAQFNAYLKETYGEDDEAPISAFCADMQDTFYDHDFVFSEWYGAKDKPVADLLSGWNQAHTFSAGALKLAKKAGIEAGNMVLIAYDHELKPNKWPDTSPVRFLGNLAYSDEPPPLAKLDLTNIKEHKNVIRLCFAPDGKTLVSGGTDGTLMAWDVESGRAITTPEYAFKGSLADVYSLMFSADGTRCVAGTLTATCLWDSFPQAGRFLEPLKHFAAKAISPDGRIAFGCELKKVTARNLADGKPVAAIDRVMDGSVLALLPDSRIATIVYEQKELHVWNTKTGKQLFSIASSIATREIAASPGGNAAVTNDGKQAIIWDLAKRTASHPIDPEADIRDVLVPTDDWWVGLLRTGPLQVRSLRTGKLTQTLGAAKDSYWKMYAAGTTVAAIATGRTNLEVWDAKTGKLLGRYPDRAKPKPDESIDAAAVSPDGSTIAVGQRSGAVRFFQLKGGKLAANGK